MSKLKQLAGNMEQVSKPINRSRSNFINSINSFSLKAGLTAGLALAGCGDDSKTFRPLSNAVPETSDAGVVQDSGSRTDARVTDAGVRDAESPTPEVSGCRLFQTTIGGCGTTLDNVRIESNRYLRLFRVQVFRTPAGEFGVLLEDVAPSGTISGNRGTITVMNELCEYAGRYAGDRVGAQASLGTNDSHTFHVAEHVDISVTLRSLVGFEGRYWAQLNIGIACTE